MVMSCAAKRSTKNMIVYFFVKEILSRASASSSTASSSVMGALLAPTAENVRLVLDFWISLSMYSVRKP